MRESRRGLEEKGSVLLSMSTAVAVLLIASIVVGGVVQRAVWRARAQAAADAAALAGVAGGSDEARDLARRNGATLVRFDDQGSAVEVEIDYRGTAAVARAGRSLEIDPTGCPSLLCSGP